MHDYIQSITLLHDKEYTAEKIVEEITKNVPNYEYKDDHIIENNLA